MRRIAITGIGLITPLGKTWDEFCDNTLAGRSAIKPVTLNMDGKPALTLPLAQVADFDAARDVPNCKIDAWDRLTHLSVYAAREAMRSAQVRGADVDGLILGSSTTSIETLDDSYRRTLLGNGRIPPLNIPKSMPNAPVSAVSIDLGITGPSYAVASACSSANQAIINAGILIGSGEAKRVLCGAVEAGLRYSNVNAWNGMRVLSKDTCRPFCKTRTGLVLGEGAVMFVLEDMEAALTRGAGICAELTGWGQSSDAHSITTPHVGGIVTALEKAMESANLSPDQISYINAHGTGTPLNDKTESAAILEALGDAGKSVPVSSTKSLHGHLLGASGAIELAATIASMQAGQIAPTMGWQQVDDAVTINIVKDMPQKAQIEHALSASYAFGGHNTVLAINWKSFEG